jgi:hypothetical protein
VIIGPGTYDFGGVVLGFGALDDQSTVNSIYFDAEFGDVIINLNTSALEPNPIPVCINADNVNGSGNFQVVLASGNLISELFASGYRLNIFVQYAFERNASLIENIGLPVVSLGELPTPEGIPDLITIQSHGWQIFVAIADKRATAYLIALWDGHPFYFFGTFADSGKQVLSHTDGTTTSFWPVSRETAEEHTRLSWVGLLYMRLLNRLAIH